MSSMEVDGVQVNGLPMTMGPRKTVRFNPTVGASAHVNVISKSIEMRPKHKARRRARQPKPDETEAMEDSPKPLSPSKLKKISEKDRHSRTGVRGLPKKGKSTLLCFSIPLSPMICGGGFPLLMCVGNTRGLVLTMFGVAYGTVSSSVYYNVLYLSVLC